MWQLQDQGLTERELGVFKAAGFPLASEVELVHHSAEELFEAILKVMRCPNARYTEAAVYSLIKLARDHAFELLPIHGVDDKILRRLGYIVEFLSTDPKLDSHVVECFRKWVKQIMSIHPLESTEPLTLSDVVTKKRMERLQNQATTLNKKWQVYGKVELRDL